MRGSTLLLLGLSGALAAFALGVFARAPRAPGPAGEVGAPRDAASAGLGAPQLAAVDPRPARVELPAGGARRGEDARPPDAPEAPTDLRARLAAAARAEGRSDEAGFEAAVRAVLDPPGGVADVLDGLASGALVDDALVLRGAVACLCVAAAQDAAHGTDRATGAILDTLPALAEAPRRDLAVALSETLVGEAPAVGAAHLARIVALCRAHPEAAADLADLVAHLDEDVAGLAGARAALEDALGVPELAASALRALWALDPLAGEAALDELRRDPARSADARREVAEAVARRAAPERALEILASERGSSAQLALFVLGERDEARGPLRDRYNALVGAGGDARERAGLVGAMHREESGVLLGIAETDPSPRVREQALLTLTSSRGVGVDAVVALRALRSGPAAVSPAACVAAAGNVVVRSEGSARAEALGLLGELALDPTLSAQDRRAALALLRKHAPTGEHDAWAIPDPGG